MSPVNTSRVWRNVACATATILVLWDGYKYGVDPWILLVYLATVGGFEWISAVIKSRFGVTGAKTDGVPKE
jgi:hypothetical protein